MLLKPRPARGAQGPKGIKERKGQDVIESGHQDQDREKVPARNKKKNEKSESE